MKNYICIKWHHMLKVGEIYRAEWKYCSTFKEHRFTVEGKDFRDYAFPAKYFSECIDAPLIGI